MNQNQITRWSKNPWTWVGSLYYAQGIPYVVVMTVSVIMYKRFGLSNTDIAFYTSWFYLPWIIKPLWSPIVDLIGTKRKWTTVMQLCIGASLAGVALTIPLDSFFQYSLAFLWLMAFSSATHDIASDGFYMLGLSHGDQAYFIGVRSTFYRLSMITGQGLLIILAGYIESNTGLESKNIAVSSIDKRQLTFEHPDSLVIKTSDETTIGIYPEHLEVSTDQMNVSQLDSVVNFVEGWNQTHGFISVVKHSSDSADTIEHSWWSQSVSAPIANYLKKIFNPVTSNDRLTSGNIGLVYIYLTGVPQENKVTVNFGKTKGNKNIVLLSGERFEFNDHNWEKPAIAIVQLDPKLKNKVSAEFQAHSGNIRLSWVVSFTCLAILFLVFFLYHAAILPRPAADIKKEGGGQKFLSEFLETFVSFFRKKNIGIAITFLLVYRLGESQLVKLASPFLLDSRNLGGMGLSTAEVGIAYGTVGIIMLSLGGIVGGIAASRKGLKYWLWWMALAINLPNLVYIYLSYAIPDSFTVVLLSVGIEQFGYGFGFTAYLLFMIYIAEGEHKTAHYAIATGFMALGMMIPGMISGWLQEIIGYSNFFIWVVLVTIPSFAVIYFLPIDAEFGKQITSD